MNAKIGFLVVGITLLAAFGFAWADPDSQTGGAAEPLAAAPLAPPPGGDGPAQNPGDAPPAEAAAAPPSAPPSTDPGAALPSDPSYLFVDPAPAPGDPWFTGYGGGPAYYPVYEPVYYYGPGFWAPWWDWYVPRVAWDYFPAYYWPDCGRGYGYAGYPGYGYSGYGGNENVAGVVNNYYVNNNYGSGSQGAAGAGPAGQGMVRPGVGAGGEPGEPARGVAGNPAGTRLGVVPGQQNLAKTPANGAPAKNAAIGKAVKPAAAVNRTVVNAPQRPAAPAAYRPNNAPPRPPVHPAANRGMQNNAPRGAAAAPPVHKRTTPTPAGK
jgi:hypothetical protein